jgi:hypothetical protein
VSEGAKERRGITSQSRNTAPTMQEPKRPTVVMRTGQGRAMTHLDIAAPRKKTKTITDEAAPAHCPFHDRHLFLAGVDQKLP